MKQRSGRGVIHVTAPAVPWHLREQTIKFDWNETRRPPEEGAAGSETLWMLRVSKQCGYQSPVALRRTPPEHVLISALGTSATLLSGGLLCLIAPFTQKLRTLRIPS